MIYPLENGNFVISSRGCWLPGSFDSEQAANYAFRFDDRQLQDLQDMANERAGGTGGSITFEDLQDYKQRDES